MESVNSVDAVAQGLDHYAVDRLRQGLEKVYSKVHVPCLVTFIRVFRVAPISIRCKVAERRGDGELKPVEGCPTETQQSFAKLSRPCGPGKGRSARCNFFGLKIFPIHRLSSFSALIVCLVLVFC